MYTRRTYKYLGHHFLISSFFSILPFRWDVQTETVSVCKSKLRLIICYFNMLTCLGPTIRMIQCFIMGLVNGERDISFLVVDFLFIIPYTLQILFQYATIFHKEEIANLINQLTTFDKKFTGNALDSMHEQIQLIT